MNQHTGNYNGIGHTRLEAQVLKYHRAEVQAVHGDRVEERQRVNGQPNGYTGPISEADLQIEHMAVRNAKLNALT